MLFGGNGRCSAEYHQIEGTATYYTNSFITYLWHDIEHVHSVYLHNIKKQWYNIQYNIKENNNHFDSGYIYRSTKKLIFLLWLPIYSGPNYISIKHVSDPFFH